MNDRACTTPGCDRKTVARRLCRKHYQQAWHAGKLDAHQKVDQRRRRPDAQVCPPDHKHADSSTCFIQHHCTCTPCNDANTARAARRRKDQAYGRYDTGLVDVAPVREHLLMLGEHGIGYKRVAELAGFRSSTPVRTIIWGRQDPGPRKGEMQKRVKRETAQRILAIQPTIENMRAGALIPSTGTVRRVQALAARGWSMSKLAARLDMECSNLFTMLDRDQVRAYTHLRVAALYDTLWDQQPPADEWHDKAARTRAIRYAANRGWLPPLAWDDIDTDPTPEPVESERTAGEDLVDDVAFMLELGESAHQITVITGRTPAAIEKAARRYGRPDIANQFTTTRRAAA